MVRYSYPDTGVYVFARNQREREFALELGAVWAGDTADRAPVGLAAMIDTTPVWKPVLAALECLRPGGRLVINAIRKEDVDRGLLADLSYEDHLWLEKEIKTVANVTHSDLAEFLLERDYEVFGLVRRTSSGVSGSSARRAPSWTSILFSTSRMVAVISSGSRCRSAYSRARS